MRVPIFLRDRGIKTILALDWETFFSQEYTLKKMSTSEYIRHEEFRAHGVGIQKHNERRPHWITHDDVEEKLGDIDWETTAMVAHHTHFDGLILTHHYGLKPAYWLDTLSMARVWIDSTIYNSLDAVASYYGIGNKIPNILGKTKGVRVLPHFLERQVADYCNQDVTLTLKLLQIMIDEGFPDDELDLIDITVRMFAEPKLNVDLETAATELSRIIERNRRVVKSTAPLFSIPRTVRGEDRMEECRSILRSDKKLADAMTNLGVTVPMKKTKAGNIKPAFAKTDLAFQELQVHPDKDIRKICEARLIVKSTVEQSKASKLILHAKPALPIYLNYGKAHTYRWTGGDKMNPQNFPRAGVLRKCIIAPKGHQIVVVDSGQIEARVVAWLAGQQDLLDVFADPNRDPYCEYASEIFGHTVTKKMTTERFVGKVGILGLGFGMGWEKYRYTLASGSMGKKVQITEDKAQEGVRVYRERNHKIVKLWKWMNNRLYEMQRETLTVDRKGLKDVVTFNFEEVTLPNGLALHYPAIEMQRRQIDNREMGFEYWNGKFYTKIYGGLFTENLTQALARIIVAQQMLEIAEKYRIVMMTHDEAAYLAPTREAQKALDFGLEIFHTSKDWYSDIPLAAEGGYASEYSK
jgi:DNA polymerase